MSVKSSQNELRELQTSGNAAELCLEMLGHAQSWHSMYWWVDLRSSQDLNTEQENIFNHSVHVSK